MFFSNCITRSRAPTPFPHRSDGGLFECLVLRRDLDSSAVGRRFLCHGRGGGQYVPPPTLAYPPAPSGGETSHRAQHYLPVQHSLPLLPRRLTYPFQLRQTLILHSHHVTNPLKHSLLNLLLHTLHPQSRSHIIHVLPSRLHLPQRFSIPIAPHIPPAFIHPLLQPHYILLPPHSRLAVKQQRTLHTRLHNPRLPPFRQPHILQLLFHFRPQTSRCSQSHVHILFHTHP